MRGYERYYKQSFKVSDILAAAKEAACIIAVALSSWGVLWLFIAALKLRGER